MYNGITKAFKEKIAEPSRTFKARLVNVADRGEIIENGFLSVKYYSQSNEDTETLSLGGTVSSYIEVELYKPFRMVTGKEYEYQIGLCMDDGSIEYVPIGLFTAQKPVEDDGKVTFTAYDRFVSRLGQLFASEFTYPVDGKYILREIQTKSGITIANISTLPDGVMIPEKSVISEEDENGNTITTHQKPFDGFSYREAIGYLAYMYGCFATVNRYGEVELRWYKETGYRVEKNMSYDDITCAETTYEVQYVECSIGEDSDNVLISGGGTTGISGNAPVMTQEILNSIYQKTGGMRYIPATLSFKGDPCLELGDIITVVKRDGTEVKVPLMTLNLDYDGGLSCEVGSYGDTEESSSSSNAGPMTKRMERVYSELLLVKEVVATKASIGYLQANYATVSELDAVNARIDKINAAEITVDYLKANYADISFANVDIANIRQGFLENLMVSQGIIADRVIGSEIVATDVLTGVNLYADDITAGTLSVDRLVFRGDEKSIVYQLNNISGALQAVSVDTLNGEIITPRSITADRIVAQSITATEIDVKDLVVTGLIGANRLTAANIFVDDLQALGATIGGFTIGATAIYNGTSSKISTTAGIYLGIDAIRAYYTGDVYTHIEKGVLKTNSALFVDRIYIASSVENTPHTAAIFNISNSESYTILSGIDEGGAEYEAAYVFSTFAKIHTMAYFSTDNLDVNHSSIFRGSVKFNECIDIDEAARIGKASIRNFLRIGGTLNVAGISTLAHTAIGGYDNTSYSLSANSFICNSWVRTVGNCGWYNETYGGGWYMIDSTYIRNYNSKHLLLSGNCYFGGTTYYVNSSGNTHFSNIYTGDRVNGAGNTGCAITNYGCMHLSRASSNGNPYVALFYNNAASATAQWTSISASCSSLSGYVNFGTNTAQSSYRAYVNGDVYCTGFVCAGAPRPSVNSTSNSTGYYLGTSSYKWRTVYAYNTSISTSDRNEKHDIFYDLDKTELEKVFDGLRLCTYVMNGGKRTHIGCIAQDIEENLVKNGYSMDDWAFLCRDHVYEEVEAESGLQKVYKYNEDGSPKYIYGLRYAELSMLTVWQTQKLKTRVSEIQRNLERVDLQEQRIQELQQQIHTLQYELDKAKLKIEKMETVA